MTNTLRATLTTLAAIALFGSNAAYADTNRRGDSTDLLLGIASAILVNEAVQHVALDRHSRSRHARAHHQGRDNSARNFGGRNSNRNGFGGSSYTSEPIRGGSSRRTRVIENPYPNRPVTGISFTGIERSAVHINDVITYPRKRLISHRGYTLSRHHRSPFLNTHGYVDYISVKAKRREHFTVTFHYE